MTWKIWGLWERQAEAMNTRYWVLAFLLGAVSGAFAATALLVLPSFRYKERLGVKHLLSFRKKYSNSSTLQGGAEMTMSNTIDKPRKKSRRAQGRVTMGKKDATRSNTRRPATTARRGKAADKSAFSGAELRAAIAAIPSTEWKRIRISRYAAVSIDEHRILAHGNDPTKVGETAAQFGHRSIVVSNKHFSEPQPRKSNRSVA
jgi:hypothetical protein